jgi:predicted PurR-regulated permease PerM
MKEERFNFGFLNKIMYIGVIIGVFYFLKNLGVMDKIFEALIALTPIYIGLLICWISMPLSNKLRKFGLNKSWAAIISLVIMFGILVLVLSLVIPMFITQLTQLITDFPKIYGNIVNIANDFLHNTLHIEKELFVSNNFNKTELVQKYGGLVVNYSISTLSNVIGFFVIVATSVVVSFFMVKDIDKFKSGVYLFLSKNSKDKNTHKMFLEIDTAIMSYIKGTLLDSAIVGVMTTIVCMILGLDYAVVFGILITILNLIPYIGAILSELIAALYALSVGGPVLAIITFICLVMVQVIDANILQPNIIAKSVNIHPVVVLGGLIVFNLLWGITGMIVAVPILAAAKIILKYKFNIVEDDDEIKIDKNKKQIREIK